VNTVILCNPENRRVKFFEEAVHRLGLPAPKVISYQGFLEDDSILKKHLTVNTLLRIESPGENFDVTKILIAKGAGLESNGDQRISEEAALELQPDLGRVQFSKEWYNGFVRLLEMVASDIKMSGARVLNTPQAIKLMFDKPACQQQLKHAGICVPDFAIGIENYDTLKTYLDNRSLNRVFIKPSHSSSASGVMAFRRQDHLETLFTSLELDDRKLYNSLKTRRYTTSSKIKILINYILSEGAIVEEWIPKASMDGKFFDLRVVVINKKARFVLPRLSSGPITNLHLGNKRGNVDDLLALIGKEKFGSIIECAEQAANSIEGIFYCGVDVLIPAGFGKPRILEVNAFGDLLPGLTTAQGDDTYTLTLKEYLYAA
jgi:hypothetical protein